MRPTKTNFQGSLGIPILGLEQEIEEMSLEHLVVLAGKEKKNSQRDTRAK